MSERMDGWRYCDDPAELAAAVADGVEVQRNWGYDWQPGTNNVTAEQFAGCTKANCRYRVPASWSWSPEPPADVPTGAERYLAERLADPEYRAAYEAAAPDDLTTRARRHAETHPESRELIEELLAEVTRWACIVGEAPPVPSWVVPPCTCKSYNLDGQVKGREEVVLDRPTWMPDGERVNGVPVDECIARVVRFLWDNDVRTWGSCCGHNGRYGPPSLLLDRREDIAWVRTLIAEVDPRIWHLDWVHLG